MYSILRILLLISFTLSVLTSCGGSGGGPDITPPTVSPGSPSSAQVNVVRNTTVTAVFSEAMNSATINASSFTLEDSSATPVVGNVSYNGVTATLTPSSLLGFIETYTVRISTDVEDVSGNALVSDQSWSFTAVAGIQIFWNANPETAVNRAEGGYKVYYSTSSGFNPGDVGVTEVDVPYTTGTTAPTSILIPLSTGTYYIRIAAYSALNAPDTSGGSISTATPQISLIAP